MGQYKEEECVCKQLLKINKKEIEMQTTSICLNATMNTKKPFHFDLGKSKIGAKMERHKSTQISMNIVAQHSIDIHVSQL